MTNHHSLDAWIQRPFHSISAVEVEGQIQLKKDSFFTWLGRRVSPDTHDRKVAAVAQHLRANLSAAGSDSTELARAFVAKHHAAHGVAARAVEALDLRLAQLATNGVTVDPNLLSDGLSASYKKWVRYGFDGAIFLQHQNFAKWLMSTPLASQIKVTRDHIRLGEAGPEILVEGQWTPFAELKDRFHCKFSSRFQDKLIYDKATNEVFTYLDNGRGLQPFHPFLFNGNTPISTLTEAELGRLQDSAKQFVRQAEAELSAEELAERNANRTFTLQIVTSKTSDANPNNPISGPFGELIRNRKHPYIRIVDDQGNVFSAGYGWKKPMHLPMMTATGQFRGPDVWDYMPADERVTTNIALNRDEAKRLRDFVLRYHNDSVNFGNSPAFNTIWQNCSVFTVNAVQVAIGESPNIYITLDQFIKRVAPPVLQTIGRALSRAKDKVSGPARKVYHILPQRARNAIEKVAQTVHRAVLSALAFTGTGLLIMMGALFGARGRQFNPDDHTAEMGPPLHNWRNWFKPDLWGVYLPGILQEWQRAQPSTAVFERPTKLAIVPGGRDQE